MLIQVHYPEEEGIPSKYRGDFTNEIKKKIMHTTSLWNHNADNVPMQAAIADTQKKHYFGIFLFCQVPSSLVACYATLHPALSVRPSACLSVRRSHFTFFFNI